MDDWEDQPAPPVLKKELLKSSWHDQDVEDNEVKDKWEDKEDESAPPPVVLLRNQSLRRFLKKVEVKVSGKDAKSASAVKEEPLNPVVEKLRQQGCHCKDTLTS